MEQNHAMKVQQLSRDSEEQRTEIERLEVALEKEKRKTVSQEGIIANLKEELSSHISPAFVHKEVSYMYIYKCMHIITTNIHSASDLLLIRLKLCVFFTVFTIINHISPTTASFCLMYQYCIWGSGLWSLRKNECTCFKQLFTIMYIYWLEYQIHYKTYGIFMRGLCSCVSKLCSSHCLRTLINLEYSK